MLLPRLLLTGFSPFLGQSINPSALLLERMQKIFPDSIDTLLLPVSFKKVFPAFQGHWQNHGPYSTVLMLGQASGRDSVCLERVAVNWMESSHADEENWRPGAQKIDPDGPDSFLIDFFSAKWAEELSALGPVQSSFSAGTFVCNSLYYQVSGYLKPMGIKTLFVHVPLLPEQTSPKQNLPSLDLANQGQIIARIISDLKPV